MWISFLGEYFEHQDSQLFILQGFQLLSVQAGIRWKMDHGDLPFRQGSNPDGHACLVGDAFLDDH